MSAESAAPEVVDDVSAEAATEVADKSVEHDSVVEHSNEENAAPEKASEDHVDAEVTHQKADLDDDTVVVAKNVGNVETHLEVVSDIHVNTACVIHDADKHIEESSHTDHVDGTHEENCVLKTNGHETSEESRSADDTDSPKPEGLKRDYPALDDEDGPKIAKIAAEIHAAPELEA